MGPSNFSALLRRIASRIDASEKPSRSSVAAALRKALEELEPEFVEDVQKIMETGIPYSSSGSELIKSNYPLEQADIFYTYSLIDERYDDRGRSEMFEHPDTDDEQQKEDSRFGKYGTCANAAALIVWPDIDLLVEYDGDGRSMSSQCRTHDEAGQHQSCSHFPDELGAESLQDVRAAAGPGSLLTNAQFAQKTAEHGYQAFEFYRW